MDEEDNFERELEIGRHNAFVIELSHRHCQLMRFEQTLGRGMLEQMSGLPINMRTIECPKVNGAMGGMQLQPIATSFYREHCIGCKLQRPTGEVPTLGALVAEEDSEAAEAAAREQERSRIAREQWAHRESARSALKIQGDPAVTAIVNDLALIDPDPSGAHSAEDLADATARLVATATRAPELFTVEATNILSALVRDERLTVLLGPLRIVAMSRRDLVSEVLDLAFAALERQASTEAIQVLVEFAEEAPIGKFTEGAVKSILRASCGVEHGSVGQLRPRTTTDAAGLLLTADLAEAQLLNTLGEMLPALEPMVPIITPGGSIGLRSDWEKAVREQDRATAATALAVLAARRPKIAELALPLLLRNVVLPGDRHEVFPQHRVAKTLAIASILQIGDVTTELETRGSTAGDEQRKRYFQVWEETAHLLDQDRRWKEEGDPDLTGIERRVVRDALFEKLLSFAGGRWGSGIAADSAEVIHRLARDEPTWAVEHLNAMFHAALESITAQSAKPTNTPLVLEGGDPDLLAPLEAYSSQMEYQAATGRYFEAVDLAANADATAVIETIGAFLDTHRAATGDTTSKTMSWRLVGLLGKVGAAAGNELGVLGRIVPTLYRYMLETDPVLASAAIEAWVEIGARHRLPSTFEDLLPALMQSPYYGVIQGTLLAAARLDFAEEAATRLMIYVVNVLRNAPKPTATHNVLLRAIPAAVKLGNKLPEYRDVVHNVALNRCADLDDHDLETVIRLRWADSVKASGDLAHLQLRVVAYRYLQVGVQDHNDSLLIDLLNCVGMEALDLGEIASVALAFEPRAILRGVEIAEVLWRFGRTADFENLVSQLAAIVPSTPAYAPQRGILSAARAAATAEVAWQKTKHAATAADLPNNSRALATELATQASVNERIRQLIAAGTANDGEKLRNAATELAAHAQRDTPTAAYIRAYTTFVAALAHLQDVAEAERSADASQRATSIRAARRRNSDALRQLNDTFSAEDPLTVRLRAGIERVRSWTAGELPEDFDQELFEFTAIPTPLLIIEGPPLERRHSAGRNQTQKAAVPPVAVALISVNNKLLTGTAVMKPESVYTLSARVHLDEWPEWANRLDLEFVTAVPAADVTLPTFSWDKPTAMDHDLRFESDGTVILRYGIAAGQPAPPFAVKVTLRGESSDRTPLAVALNVAGHPQIRMRPYDASRDSVTQYAAIDERLLELYTALPEAGYNETEVQAFCRLFTAICRIGLEMTWDRQYKRGQAVTERKFHDDLFARLLEEPELEGRVERGSRAAHGFLDIRHDSITAELKVERQTAVTRERAAKYMAQVVQYAASDGSRLSILAILDMSRKELPVGTPENYMFPLHPAHHGIDDPAAPSTVYTLVVNGNLPVPSSWSRKKAGRERTKRASAEDAE
ncbi:hypothetical protein IT072_01600 [Leifsonia sp. ZF2019]|uniref:hypothetical protein n=1 Tax=Leifsonia sp. ZF2019 TaxID=2781978 RepID=UPI001CBD9A20|nr:hypothetical protein [Leifsonia sp. ZF2019]UAJ79805.1 hypothetical protein IT072_01600 [Leifsonia sp. ZF2019]